MSDLERHRILRNMTLVGWPLYDEDDNLVGFVDEPEWTVDDLTAEHWAIIEEDTQKCMTRGQDHEGARAFVLAEYGIACPHKWEAPGMQPWLECRYCRLSKPRPGRPVIIEGRGDMWVPDPPPPRLLLPRPVKVSAFTEQSMDPDAALNVDEYRWTGGRYRAVNIGASGDDDVSTEREENPDPLLGAP